MGRPVEICTYAERIEARQDGRLVGEHTHAFGRWIRHLQIRIPDVL